MGITIKEVNTRKEFRRFLHLPYKIFKGNAYWTPPLLLDERNTFNPSKNPAFEYCLCKLWNAYDENGEYVGRIAGIINNRSNEIWNEKKVRFGWIDFIDSQEVAEALIKTVGDWGKKHGLTRMHGPLGFTDMDREGMLIEGFEYLCPMSSIYNHPYYKERLEEAGFEKEVDWIQNEMNASQDVPEKVAHVSSMIKDKYQLSLLEIKSMKKLASQYGVPFFQALNLSFKNLYGYVPLTEKQMKYYINLYFPFLRKKLICFVVDKDQNVVGFGISMPSLSKALQKCKGKIFPFGWYYLMKALKKHEHIDLYLNGVVPEWQSKGVHTIYYSEMNKSYIKLGVKTAITNPQLETNQASIIWNKYGGKIVMRRRAYGRDIDQSTEK